MRVRGHLTALVLSGLVLACTADEENGSPTAPSAPRPSAGIVIFPDGGERILPGTWDTDADGLSDVDEELLLRQFRPFWYFDNQENGFPISVTEWSKLGRYVGASWNAYSSISTLRNAVNTLPSGTMYTVEGFYQEPGLCYDTEVGPWPSWITDCNDAPVYVDAVPVKNSNFVWLHYYLFFQVDVKDVSSTWWNPFITDVNHWGDWEHVCVLVTRDMIGYYDVTKKTQGPIGIHFHHHGDVTSTNMALAWHQDRRCQQYGVSHYQCYGTKHPRVYVQAWTHGMYRSPGSDYRGPYQGGWGTYDDQLDNPLVFMTPHGLSGLEGEVVRMFKGRWGHSTSVNPWGNSPKGPMIFNGLADHDYKPSPLIGDWL